MTEQRPSSRLLGLDFLRGIAAFGIVACHLELLPLTPDGWTLRALCDMNVGLFAALSGYLMFAHARRPTSFHDYLHRRARRLLPVYFLWTLLYILFGFVFDTAIRHALNPKWLEVGYYPAVLLQGRAAGHLWFLISLFYCQLLFYPLHEFATRVLPRFSTLIWFVLGFLCVVGSALLRDFWFGAYFLRPLGFLVTGSALAEMSKRLAGVKGSIWGVLALFAIVVHYLLAGRVPVFVRDWFVAVPLLMMFAKSTMVFEKPSLAASARVLGLTSLGVYLIHPVFAQAFKQVLTRLFSAPFGPIPLMISWLGSWLCAFVCALILTRSTRMRKWVV